MANTRGVFNLRKLTEEKIPLNEWVDLDNVWHSPSPSGTGPAAGYFGGGGYPVTNTMDKLSYPSETSAELPSGANLSVARWRLAATGNLTHGYFAGGTIPGGTGPFLTMDKVTYASDTTAAAPGANLNTAHYGMAATSSLSAGYFAGGTPGSFTLIEKVTYSSDTTAVLPSDANLSAQRYNLAGTGNTTAGYFGGGGYSGYHTMVHKTTYATDTTGDFLLVQT